MTIKASITGISIAGKTFTADPEWTKPLEETERMQVLNYTKKIREYCDYLDRHIRNVEKAWLVFEDACNECCGLYDDFRYFSILDSVRSHDLSKVSQEEFIPYVQNFYPVDDPDSFPYPADFQKAWTHHKKENLHHWENWTTKIGKGHPHRAEIAVALMVIDWLAMSYEFGGTPREYYEANKGKIHIPEDYVDYMYRIFEALETHKPEVTND